MGLTQALVVAVLFVLAGGLARASGRGGCWAGCAAARRCGPGGCEALLAGLWGVTGLGWALGLLPGRLLPLLLGLGWLGVAAGRSTCSTAGCRMR